jgi:hypothetical protein
MDGVTSCYTLVLAEDGNDGAPVTDFIVTDGGVLLATGDHGGTWRWYGLVDPELFLLDLGFIEAWESTTAPAPRPASRRRLIAA